MELLSIKETCKRTSISRTGIWRRVKDGEFPRPVSVGGIRKAFVRDEVDQWIAERIEARDRGQAA